MLAAYIAATVLGGTLLIGSLLTGHHGGVHEFDHAGHDTEGHGSALTAFVLSLRFWTYLLAFGGASGLLLHKLAHVGEPYAFLLSLVTGAASGIFAQLAVHKLGSHTGGTVASREMVYRLGTMLLPASPGVASRVRVTVNNQSIDLIATTEDLALAARDEVVVLDIKDGVAHVTKNDPNKGKNP